MFFQINWTFQLLQPWLKYPRRQAALIRKIVDRIRNSLELQVVLQTAVDEVAALLKLDGCKFLWYFKDTQRVQVVCEHSNDTLHVSDLGYHPLESFGAASRAIAAGELIINSGRVRDNRPVEKGRAAFFQRAENLCEAALGVGSMAKQLPRLLKAISQYSKRSDDSQANYKIFGYSASLLIPVSDKESSIGFIACLCEQPRTWSVAEIEFLEAIAESLEIAMRQARLYEQTQQQAQKSEMQAQKMSEMLEELRLTQVQLIQSEKMSSLGRMVAGVAHEINNPINFIYGNIPYVDNYVSTLIRLVEAYQAHYTEPPSQLQKLAEETEITFLLRDLPKILKSMQLGAERIHEIVQLLQKFSGNHDGSLKVIDLNAALESTLLILHNQMTGIKVERQYDTLPPVECYPKAINQVFLSIITNAIEALNRWSEPNKILTLRTQWIPNSEIADKGRVRIAIADNGPGIQPDIQPKIFEPFFTTKEVGQGRGLGLTISYQTIINQHNGQLEVISQPGQGSQFLLEIPLRHPKLLISNPSVYQAMTAASPTKSPLTNPHR